MKFPDDILSFTTERQISILSKSYKVRAQLFAASVTHERLQEQDDGIEIVIASLLGVFLFPALASHNMENNFNSENSNHSEIRVSTNLKDRSEAWKTIWDFKAGYVATKVFSKNTCIIATTNKRFWLGKHFSTPPQGDKGPVTYQLQPRENRFIISRNRIQSLSPYGKRIQALCRGIPSYLAYPAPGSNFLRGSNFSSGSNFLERDIS